MLLLAFDYDADVQRFMFDDGLVRHAAIGCR